jgi:hypothetical protein
VAAYIGLAGWEQTDGERSDRKKMGWNNGEKSNYVAV